MSHPCISLFSKLCAKEVKWFAGWSGKKPLREMPEKCYKAFLNVRGILRNALKYSGENRRI